MHKFKQIIKQKINQIKSLSTNKLSIIVLVFWAFASRGFGVIRESLIGRLPPLQADMLNSASIINETIVGVFILGGVGISTMPLIARIENYLLTEKDKKNKSDIEVENQKIVNEKNVNIYISWLLVILTSLVTFISLTGIIFSENVLNIMNKDFFDKVAMAGFTSEYIVLNQIFLVIPALFGIKAILGVFLNSKKAFKIYSLDGVIANVGSILGLSVFYIFFGITGAAIGLTLAFLVVAILFYKECTKFGFRFSLEKFPLLGSHLIKTLYLIIPRLFLVSAPRWAEILVSIFNNSEASITTARSSFNIQGVSLGLMMAVGTVLLPDLTNILHTKGSGGQFWKLLDGYLKKTIFVSALATVGTFILAPVILYFIKFFAFTNATSTLGQDKYVWQIIFLIFIGSLAIIPQALGEIVNRYYVAVENNIIPIISNIIGNVAALIVCIILISNYKMDAAYGVTIAFVCNVLITTGILYIFMLKDRKNS